MTLQGSEKQIAWASQIIESCRQDVEQIPHAAALPIYRERFERLVEAQTSAAWWIEHRGADLRRILRTRGERLGRSKVGQDDWNPLALEV